MSVYNGERYLHEAVESILNQTFSDFEFIIIDDGSTDTTWKILNEYAQKDNRIILIKNNNNIGITRSLNKGLKVAKSQYIARMDADDVSLPDRLLKQITFMEAHPEIGVLGTWVECIDENNVMLEKWHMPTSPALIRWSLIFGNCVAHPTVMMRHEIIKQLGYYDTNIHYAQDYDLWVRASMITQITNIPEVLLKRRISKNSIGLYYQHIQEKYAAQITHRIITQILNKEVPMELIINLRKSINGSSIPNIQQIESLVELLQCLYSAYLKVNSINRKEKKEISKDASTKLHNLAISASNISLWKGFTIFLYALKLNPQLLSVQTIINGLKVLAKRHH